MRISVSDARRLGALPKPKPPTAAQRELAKAEREKFEDALAAQLAAKLRPKGIVFVRQAHVMHGRQYRADFVIYSHRLAVEVDGGTWLPYSHHGRAGYDADRERDADLLIAGWRVLRVTPKQVMDGRAASWVEQIVWPKV